MTTDYIEFIEHNDWEGETWVFYLQIGPNMDAITRIQEGIDRDQFEFGGPVPAEAVETIVHYQVDLGGYYPTYTKVDGELDMVRINDLIEDGSLADVLSKGGIADLVLASDNDDDDDDLEDAEEDDDLDEDEVFVD